METEVCCRFLPKSTFSSFQAVCVRFVFFLLLFWNTNSPVESIKILRKVEKLLCQLKVNANKKTKQNWTGLMRRQQRSQNQTNIIAIFDGTSSSSVV